RWTVLQLLPAAMRFFCWSVTCGQRFKSTAHLRRLRLSCLLTPNRRNRACKAAVTPPPVAAGSCAIGVVELAVKRRAADFQPARDLRHLAAIMCNRKADDFVLHLFQRTHVA